MPFINYFMTTTFGPDEVTRSYYLSHLAALPSAQGKGLGSGLCRALLVRAEAEGEGVTLLTQKDDNVRCPVSTSGGS
jgi:ribosomal protein S18 acetylase RimI-like enzyme